MVVTSMLRQQGVQVVVLVILPVLRRIPSLSIVCSRMTSVRVVYLALLGEVQKQEVVSMAIGEV